MRRTLALAGFWLLVPSVTCAPPARPGILGLSFVRIKVSALDKAADFYGSELKLPRSDSGSSVPQTTNFFINAYQRIEILQDSGTPSKNMIDEIGFRTADPVALHRYLTARGLKPGKVISDSPSAKHFEMLDPEQHRLIFLSMGNFLASVLGDGQQLSQRMIHTGFVVHDRAAEDHFYKDILGFRLYWHGGMKDDLDNWVAMQVPDGKDWIEYMLNVSPNADHHTLGVMNHISLGVEDIHATEKQLIANGWKPGEAPKIGRDGKWQLNLYDPDDTRVEFMEFKPAEKPCCSEFTGPHPGPQQ